MAVGGLQTAGRFALVTGDRWRYVWGVIDEGIQKKGTDMYCRNCGNEVNPNAVACVKCGLHPNDGGAYCQACGKDTQPGAVMCVHCGARLALPAARRAAGSDKKIIAGVCGILLGALGVHKFVLGYTPAGIIMLVITVVSCGILALITGTIGLIEGIVYLAKSDDDFVRTYIEQERQWF